MVKVFGCRPAEIERLGVGRRMETAHARTRGDAFTVYGDLSFPHCRRKDAADINLLLPDEVQQV